MGRFVKNAPLSMSGTAPRRMEIRGEVILDKENFAKAGEGLEKKFATMRNLASGVMKRKKGFELPPSFAMKFFPYNIEVIEDGAAPLPNTQSGKMKVCSPSHPPFRL